MPGKKSFLALIGPGSDEGDDDGPKSGPGGGDDMEETESDTASALMDAIKSNDPKAFASAFHDMYDLCKGKDY